VRTPKVAWQDRLASDAYLRNLAAAGLRPEDIHIVMCTHLHTDHVGWNTYLKDGRWVPTFPNARYLMAREEYEYFARLFASKPDYPVAHGSFEDSVLPVVQAGLHEVVDMHHVVEGHLDDGVWMEPGNASGSIFLNADVRGSTITCNGASVLLNLDCDSTKSPECVQS
jgi:glyoxylase-like metal-dependent hydrolase (beta-lactamase superfamily II)